MLSPGGRNEKIFENPPDPILSKSDYRASIFTKIILNRTVKWPILAFDSTIEPLSVSVQLIGVRSV